MKNLVALCYRGDILALESIDVIKTWDMEKRFKHSLLTKLAEVALPDHEPTLHGVYWDAKWKQRLHDLLLILYKSRDTYGERCYGPFGDVISVSVLDEFARGESLPVLVNFIAPKAFLKPGVAADTVVIATNEEEHYSIGIVRGKGHAEGCAGLVGGFIDIDGPVIESPLHAAVRELEEEIGVKALGRDGWPLRESELIARSPQEARVFFPDKTAVIGTFQFIGMFRTTDEYITESPYGLKRVYWAFGHVLFIRFPRYSALSKEILEAMCSADAHETHGLSVERIFENGRPSFPDFPIRHHREIFEAACTTLIAHGKFPAFQLSV